VADPKTYTEEELNAAVEERLAGAKAEQDKAFKQLWEEAKKAKAQLKAWDGKDPAKYDELVQAAEAAAQKKAAAEGDFETLKKQMSEKHSSELAAREAKIAKLNKAIERRLVDAELTRAIAAKKGEPDLLLPYARQFVRVKETEEDFEGYIADERGTPLVADGKGTPMTFDSFVEQTLMTKFPRAFEGTGSSGGGSAKSNAGGGGTVGRIAAPTHGSFGQDFLDNAQAIRDGKVTVG